MGLPRGVARGALLLALLALLAVMDVGVGVAPALAASTTYQVASQTQLATALQSAAAGDTIQFTGSITLTADLPIVRSGVTIDGGGFTLDGGSQFRGFMLLNPSVVSNAGSVTPMAVTIENLTIADTDAQGGAGHDGGGGGAGLGGALFVGDGVQLSTANLTLSGDRAVGGAGGATNTAGGDGGGGGGMGGAGGAAPSGGGGGLGTGSDGGSNGTAGAQGIASGLAPGGAGASGAAGGPYGGGGGGALGSGTDAAGGGGIGGSAGSVSGSNTSGNGGFGGGGGYTYWGYGSGSGGFGGGGGTTCCYESTGVLAGLPGFGGGAIPGGNGGGGADGGFGGGAGAGTQEPNGGGGGAGMGGAVFVQSGGTLTVGGALNVNGSTVTGGAGGPGADSGSAFGPGVFLQGAGTAVTFAPAAGQTSTISNGIADQAGSGGSDVPWSLTMSGAGTLVLAGTNTYAGTTTVSSGLTEISGSIAGSATVESGGSLDVSGTVHGSVTVDSGGWLCNTGTIDGGIVNNGGTVNGSGCAAPPTATISAPADGGNYVQGTSVTTTFTCAEGTGGPGLKSCSDSNGVSGVGGTLHGTLDTSRAGTFTYTVTATSQNGLTGTASITYTVQEPCQNEVHFQLTQVTGSGSGCLYKQPDGSYQSVGPLKINGIPLPALSADHPYVLTPPTQAHPGGMFGVLAVGSAPPAVNIDLGGSSGFDVFDGTISWNLPAVPSDGSNLGTVATLTVPDGQYLKGLRIGGSVAMAFGIDSNGTYYATFPLTVDLPAILKNGPGKDATGVTGTAAVRVDASGVHFDGVAVQVTGAYIGSLEVKSACFSYLPGGASGAVQGCPAPALPGSPLPSLTCTAGGGASWSGSADIVLPIKPSPEISLYGLMSGDGLDGLSVAASGLKVPIGEDVFLTSLGIQLCVPNANQGLAIAGAVGVSALPDGDRYGLTVTGAFAYHAAFQSNPWSLTLGGSIAVYGTQVGQATLSFGETPVVSFDLQAGVDFSVVSVSGELAGWFETASPYQFSIAGSASMCLKDVGCATGQGAVSSAGISGCISVGTFTWWTLEKDSNWNWLHWWRLHWVEHSVPLEAGFGYYWRGSVSLWSSSCNIGNYELSPPGSAIDAAAGRFVVPRGSPMLSVAIDGRGGAPRVTISGPGGVTIRPPANGRTADRGPHGDMLVENAQQDTTSVLLVHPPAGIWRVGSAPGSAPIARIRTARMQAPPIIFGATHPEGAGRFGVALAYALPPGESLRLSVRGPGRREQLLGVAHGRPCPADQAAPSGPRGRLCAQLAFRATYGPSGLRTILGVVTHGGLVVSQTALARIRVSFPAPRVARPVIARRGRGIAIRWTAVPYASRYAVGVDLGDGRKLSITTSGRATSVAHVVRSVAVRVTVWPILADGTIGPSSSAALPGTSPGGGCPAATGSLSGTRLGLVTLGMTRAQAEHAYRASSHRGNSYEESFCLTPAGVQVGYPTPKLLATLSGPARRSLGGRIIWVSTANPRYSLRAVRVGMTLRRARRILPGGHLLRVRGGEWYLVPVGPVTGAVRVERGRIAEVGIIAAGVTHTARQQRAVVAGLR